MKIAERRALDELLARAAAETKVEKMTIKRSVARHKVIFHVELRVEIRCEDDEDRIISGKTYDISPSGIGIQTREEVLVGIDVAVRQSFVERPRWISGVVRHCTSTLNGYKVGIRFNVD
jgi:hypothetical protein